MKNQKGITLISLVITIIILIVLAGVTLSLVVGEDSLIQKAIAAGNKYKIAQIEEKMKLEILNAETEAKLRGEDLEKAQLTDIINKYGTLQEDGDTIVTKDDEFKLSLNDIWYGVLSDSGSYTDKIEQIKILEEKLEALQKQYDELEELNNGSSETLKELTNKITVLQEEHDKLKTEIADTLTNAGITTSPDDTVDTILGNIKDFNYQISNMGDYVILAATNVSGNVNIADIFPDYYKQLTISNFILVPRDITGTTTSSSGSFMAYRSMPETYTDTHSFSKEYNADSGILTVSFSHYSRRLTDCSGHCSSADARLTVNTTFDVYICGKGNMFTSSKRVVKVHSGTCTNNSISVDISSKFDENTYIFPTDVIFEIDSCSYNVTSTGTNNGNGNGGERSVTKTATPNFLINKSLNNKTITVNITNNYNNSKIPQFNYNIYILN